MGLKKKREAAAKNVQATKKSKQDPEVQEDNLADEDSSEEEMQVLITPANKTPERKQSTREEQSKQKSPQKGGESEDEDDDYLDLELDDFDEEDNDDDEEEKNQEPVGVGKSKDIKNTRKNTQTAKARQTLNEEVKKGALKSGDSEDEDDNYFIVESLDFELDDIDEGDSDDEEEKNQEPVGVDKSKDIKNTPKNAQTAKAGQTLNEEVKKGALKSGDSEDEDDDYLDLELDDFDEEDNDEEEKNQEPVGVDKSKDIKNTLKNAQTAKAGQTLNEEVKKGALKSGDSEDDVNLDLELDDIDKEDSDDEEEKNQEPVGVDKSKDIKNTPKNPQTAKAGHTMKEEVKKGALKSGDSEDDVNLDLELDEEGEEDDDEEKNEEPVKNATGGGGGKNCPTISGDDSGKRSLEGACFKCNKKGHKVYQCPDVSSKNACYKCDKEGHKARDCPDASSEERACFKCNKKGHVSRDCPDASSERGDSGKRSLEGACFKSNKKGHIVRHCPDGSSKNACFKCDKEGHKARDCPDASSEERANKEGHKVRDCPDASSGGGRSSGRPWYKCNKEGHISRDYPNALTGSRAEKELEALNHGTGQPDGNGPNFGNNQRSDLPEIHDSVPANKCGLVIGDGGDSKDDDDLDLELDDIDEDGEEDDEELEKNKEPLKNAKECLANMDTNNAWGRPHLSKAEEIPLSYKETKKVLKRAMACESSLKTVLYASRLRETVLKRVNALSCNVLQSRFLLEKIIKDTRLLERETYMKKELALILIYELVFGKGLLGESKPVLTILKYEKEIREAYENALKEGISLTTDLQSLPRYARVNTLLTNISAVHRNFINNGFQEVCYDEDISEDGYLDLVRNLEPGTFVIDYHFKDLFVFAKSEDLTLLELYKHGHILIQDKASYLPVHVLNPEPNATVLDACAAPGMKTIHIAARMENKGKIFAYDRDRKRIKILEDRLKISGTTICKTACEDFYKVNPHDPKFRSLEYILVDPSCSGSGMVARMDFVTDTKASKDPTRIQQLARFQILMLKHALSFPTVKRVVYSTCSIHEEENEYVVHEVLKQFYRIFKLAKVLPDWPIRGSDKFEYGNLCLRASPEKSLTNGFFVAMFERLEYDEQQSIYSDYSGLSNSSRDRQKRKKSSPQSKTETEAHNCSDEDTRNQDDRHNASFTDEPKRKKHKKKHYDIEDLDSLPESSLMNTGTTCTSEPEISTMSNINTTKKKKHSKRDPVKLESLEDSYNVGDMNKGDNSEREMDPTIVADGNHGKNTHKKKHCNLEDSTSEVNGALLDTNVIDTETISSVAASKEKKKKHKKEHSETENSSSEQFNSLQETYSVNTEMIVPSVPDNLLLSNSLKDKRKKHKKSHSEMEDSSGEQLNSLHETYSMETETVVPCVSVNHNSHKDKKKKHKERSSETEVCEQFDFYKKLFL